MEFVSVPSTHAFDVATQVVTPTGTALAEACRAKTRAPRADVCAVLGAGARTVPPLQWWRRLPADAFTAAHLGVLRRAVSGIGMVGEPRWADAVHGHPVAAVAVALRVMQERRPLLPIVDLTMST